MERRQFLATGAALTAGAVLPALTGRSAGAADRGARTAAGRLPARAEIVAVLRRVADHWIGAHADPGDNQWARATFFSGLMALHRLTREPRYLAYATGWAEKHSYGLHNGVTTRHADDHCAGQAYLDLYALDASPDPAKIAAIEDSLARMVHNSDQKHDDWWWDDALHMAMPPFARLGALRDDPAYWDAMHALYTHTRSAEGGPGLLDPGTGLWYRDKRFLPGGIASPSGKPVLWSRGNGWVAGAHAKVLAVLPDSYPHVPAYRAALTAELTALRGIQRPDGFWNVNLADPAHLPGPETSGTAFFTYGTAHAVRTGLVPRDAFRAVAARAWNGMVDTALHPDGFLGYVQNVGDRPESSQPVTYDSTADFGVGGFLLAGTELVALGDG
ncbi:glycoside hydrolase family 88 protein [Streptomyces sp. NPDC091266]|uniref:glycoside hydrolase family 88 protein n=1 Tax=Streptomyces sp. NPDC091266 TaxID=3365978 RepID=UPI0037FF538D